MIIRLPWSSDQDVSDTSTLFSDLVQQNLSSVLEADRAGGDQEHFLLEKFPGSLASATSEGAQALHDAWSVRQVR